MNENSYCGNLIQCSRLLFIMKVNRARLLNSTMPVSVEMSTTSRTQTSIPKLLQLTFAVHYTFSNTKHRYRNLFSCILPSPSISFLYIYEYSGVSLSNETARQSLSTRRSLSTNYTYTSLTTTQSPKIINNVNRLQQKEEC